MREQEQQQGQSKRLPFIARRGLTERQAADYMGETINGLNEGVRRGYYPGPRHTSNGRKVWDQKTLDVAFDKLSGIGDDGEQAALDAIQ